MSESKLSPAEIAKAVCDRLYEIYGPTLPLGLQHEILIQLRKHLNAK